MSPIASVSSPADTIGRILLAAGSHRAARAAGVRATDPARIAPSEAVSTRPADDSGLRGTAPGAEDDDGAESLFGPAAVYEPSDHARETVLGERPDEPSTDDEDSGLGSRRLTEDEQKQVDGLKRRDQEVRQHEAAHKAAAGSYAAGGPSFEYTSGPDGKRYAVGGEVQIDTSAVSGNPDATISKMQQIRRAALAPADPSGQDRAIAAQASQTESKARAERSEERKPARASGAGGAYNAAAAGASEAEAGQRLDVTV